MFNGISARGYRPHLPNFCNLGIMLRLLLLVNFLCIAAVVVKAEKLSDVSGLYLTASVVVQPVLMLSLLLLCGLRRWLRDLGHDYEILAFLAIETLIGALVFYVMRATLVDAQLPVWQYILLFVFVNIAVLFYFDMRSRALSPSFTESRLQALQARIRPHFLFNSMNAALSLIRSQPQRAERVLENMAELFRGLMNDNRQLVRLHDEVNLCLNYLEIEQIRLGERLVVNWKIEAMPANALVPPLMLQPLVENAVYHGIEPRSEPGEIGIEIIERGRELVITLTNPLPTAAKSSQSASHAHGNRVGNHMAIDNIKERLQLHFDAEASLKADTHNGIYRVVIVLPNLDREP